MSQREAVPFTNEFGQVINPGDEIVVVTHCTGSTNTTKGFYEGLLGKRVQALVERDVWEWYNKETDAVGNYYKIPSELRGYRKKTKMCITTLNKNRIYKI